MEIPFRSRSDSTHWAFVMIFEPQQIMAVCNGDVPRLNIQAKFKRTPLANNQPQDLYPVVLELHGKLTRANEHFELGAALLPSEAMPINLASTNAEEYINLSFAFSARYLQLLEEQRTSQPGQNVSLAIRMWGVAAVMRSRSGASDTRVVSQPSSSEVIRFENVYSDNASLSIQIARSDWVDRILPDLGYRRSVLIELPLIRTPPVPEAYQKAAEALDKARRAFDEGDYRGAVKYGREVLEHLGQCSSDGKFKTFCKEFLEPAVSETKSQAVSYSLSAMWEITNASSHANPFIADRAIAAYVIETLALNLRYISSVIPM